MSNIEPTEEQLQANAPVTEEHITAVRDALKCTCSAECFSTSCPHVRNALYRLLAEREAKLRDELEAAFAASAQEVAAEVISQMERDRIENDTLRAQLQKANADYAAVARDAYAQKSEFGTASSKLRARVAELEAVADEVSDMRAQLDIADTREAQHLADIKALRAEASEAYSVVGWLKIEAVRAKACETKLKSYVKRLRSALEDRVDIGPDEADALLADTAHYDDAKADAPASTEGEATDE